MGHKREDGIEETQRLPPLEFGYSEFDPKERNFEPVAGNVPTRSLSIQIWSWRTSTANGLPDIVEMNGTVRSLAKSR